MQEKINSIINSNGYSLRVSDYFSESWELIKPHLGSFILFTLLGIVVSAIASIIPGAGVVISPIISGGTFLALREADKGNEVTLNTFFEVFKGNQFAQLLGGSLVSAILTVVAMMCLVLPGIYLGIAYAFVAPLILFSHTTDFWENMENSRKIITKNWWGLFGLLIVMGICVVLGVILTLGLGLFIAMPWATGVIYCAYKDVVGFEARERDIVEHLV